MQQSTELASLRSERDKHPCELLLESKSKFTTKNRDQDRRLKDAEQYLTSTAISAN